MKSCESSKVQTSKSFLQDDRFWVEVRTRRSKPAAEGSVALFWRLSSASKNMHGLATVCNSHQVAGFARTSKLLLECLRGQRMAEQETSKPTSSSWRKRVKKPLSTGQDDRGKQSWASTSSPGHLAATSWVISFFAFFCISGRG